MEISDLSLAARDCDADFKFLSRRPWLSIHIDCSLRVYSSATGAKFRTWTFPGKAPISQILSLSFSSNDSQSVLSVIYPIHDMSVAVSQVPVLEDERYGPCKGFRKALNSRLPRLMEALGLSLLQPRGMCEFRTKMWSLYEGFYCVESIPGGPAF